MKSLTKKLSEFVVRRIPFVSKLKSEWEWPYRARQWLSYENYVTLPLMAGALCYTAANTISQDTFNLQTIAPFYEASMGTYFRFKNFKSWEQLATEFADGYASITGCEREIAMNAIYALKTKDHVVCLKFVFGLNQQAVFQTYPTLFNQLVDICVRLSKVDVLRELNKINPALTGLNKEAKSLLNNPCAHQIQYVTEQFISGPGSMRDSGADVFVNVMYQTELNDAYDAFLASQLNIHDADEFPLVGFLEHRKKTAEVYERYSREHIAVITEFPHGNEKKSPEEQFKIFATLLKNNLLENQLVSVDGTFLLAGGHFRCGRLRLEKNVNNEIVAKLLLIDGKGADWGQSCFPYYFLLHDLFNGKFQVFISEELIQKAKVGCSFIAAQQFYYLLHAPLYFPEGNIFSFVEKNTTGNAYLVQAEEERIQTVITANTTRLPAALCIFRQVTDDKHVYDKVLQEYNKEYLKKGDLFEKAFRMEKRAKPDLEKGEITQGRCALLTDLDKRSDEYKAPSTPRERDGSTLGDLVRSNLGRQANGKPANLGAEHFSFFAGNVVSHSLRKDRFFENGSFDANPFRLLLSSTKSYMRL